MSSACFPAADKYFVPGAVVYPIGYDSNFSTDATVSLPPESNMSATLLLCTHEADQQVGLFCSRSLEGNRIFLY